MCSDLAPVIERVARLRITSAGRAPSGALVAAIEDVLTAGYASALAADGCCMRIEQRLQELLIDASAAAEGELPELGSEHARLREDLSTLRQALAELRSDRDRLHADLLATSG